MAEKVTLKSNDTNEIIYPQTLVDLVQDEDGNMLPELVLMKDNTTEFTPTSDYQPATKKYVDEHSGGGAADSVNGKTGMVVLSANDVGAISTSDITQTLGNSTAKVPSEKAVADAIGAAGGGDMSKATYDPTGVVSDAGGIPAYVAANGSGKIDAIKVNNVEQAITDKTVNITVPTNNNQLTNGAGYITEATLVPYAKTADIPTKTSDLTNNSGYITSSDIPVKSVNGKTGEISLTAADVSALPDTTVIPTVNNGTLTIQKNGEDVATFSANDSTNVTANITVPTSKSDIGLGNVDNVKQYSADNPPPYPVTSVNGMTGEVTIDISGGGGVNIVLSETQPTDLKAGNYWYQIIT